MTRALLVVAALTFTAATALGQGKAEPPKGTEKAPAPGFVKGEPHPGAPPPGEPPALPKPGPETLALKPFAANLTTTGKVMADAMGPGSPEMPSKGHHNCKWT